MERSHSYTKEDSAKASNYRIVCPTCICCKSVEHILQSHIINHLESAKILPESQRINTVQDLADGMNSENDIDHVLRDFSKAFL